MTKIEAKVENVEDADFEFTRATIELLQLSPVIANVYVDGNDISRNVKSLDIHLESEEPASVDIKLFDDYDEEAIFPDED